MGSFCVGIQVLEYRTEHIQHRRAQGKRHNLTPLDRFTASNTDDESNDGSITYSKDLNVHLEGTTLRKKLALINTLGIYRVRNFFRHWVIVARIMTMHGLFLRKARHRQREK